MNFSFDDFISIENNGLRPTSTNIRQKCHETSILSQHRAGFIHYIAIRLTVIIKRFAENFSNNIFFNFLILKIFRISNKLFRYCFESSTARLKFFRFGNGGNIVRTDEL